MIGLGDAQPSNRLIDAESKGQLTLQPDNNGDMREVACNNNKNNNGRNGSCLTLSADSDGQLPIDCLIVLLSADT